MPAWMKRKILSINNRTSRCSSSRKYSAIVSAACPTRKRLPGGSFIWPKTIELKDIIAMLGLEQLSQQDRNIVFRARQLDRFLTQPFFTTEHFTSMKGRAVSLNDAL